MQPGYVQRAHHSVPGAVNAISRTHRRRAQPPPFSSAAERGPTYYPTVLSFRRSPTSTCPSGSSSSTRERAALAKRVSRHWWEHYLVLAFEFMCGNGIRRGEPGLSRDRSLSICSPLVALASSVR